ncbi:MAG: DUF2232 domain-containing protein [Pseudomonadota bacterium]
MQNRTILIAATCGLLAAWLFMAPLLLGGLGAAISIFTAAPIFVSVLGFGTVAGLITGAVGAGVILLVLGPLSAFLLLLVTLGPALWIGHMAGLSRDDNDDGVMEWYPLSQILLRMAGMCAAIVLILGAITGFTIETATAQIAEYLKQFLNAAQTGGTPLSDEQINQRAVVAGRLITVGFPASLLFLMVGNLLLAERFCRKRGWILRPQALLKWDVALPPAAIIVFAACVVVGFLPGNMGLAGQVGIGAFGGAFMLVGLAALHWITRKSAARPFLLGITYSAILFTQIMVPIMAIFGLVETLFGLRARSAAKDNQARP